MKDLYIYFLGYQDRVLVVFRAYLVVTLDKQFNLRTFYSGGPLGALFPLEVKAGLKEEGRG